MQQKTQCDPDESRRGEVQNPAPSGAETAQAQPEREIPSSGDSLMEVTRRPGFIDECRRQSRIVAHADARDDDIGDFFDDAAGDIDGWDE